MGVFDGVGGVFNDGMDPAAMSNAMAVDISRELHDRLETGSQEYDKVIYAYLRGSVMPNNPRGGLARLASLFFIYNIRLDFKLCFLVSTPTLFGHCRPLCSVPLCAPGHPQRYHAAWLF